MNFDSFGFFSFWLLSAAWTVSILVQVWAFFGLYCRLVAIVYVDMLLCRILDRFLDCYGQHMEAFGAGLLGLLLIATCLSWHLLAK